MWKRSAEVTTTKVACVRVRDSGCEGFDRLRLHDACKQVVWAGGDADVERCGKDLTPFRLASDASAARHLISNTVPLVILLVVLAGSRARSWVDNSRRSRLQHRRHGAGRSLRSCYGVNFGANGSAKPPSFSP